MAEKEIMKLAVIACELHESSGASPLIRKVPTRSVIKNKDFRLDSATTRSGEKTAPSFSGHYQL